MENKLSNWLSKLKCIVFGIFHASVYGFAIGKKYEVGDNF